MSLLGKILLAASSALALPWAGWRFVREVESQLRQAQEQAQLSSAGMLAKLLALRHVQLPPAQSALHVVASRHAIVVDGYADDWSALRGYAQAAGPSDDPHKLDVLFARDPGAGLCMLATVRDATRTRADPADPRISISDHVTLVLTQGGETRRYALGGAAPGSFTSPAQGPGMLLPDAISGVYQEDGSGYRVELRLPPDVAPDALGVGVYDAAAPSADAPEPHPLLGFDRATSSLLETLVPAHARARLISADGWLIAAAGKLDASPSPGDGDSVAADGWLGNIVYRNLVAPALGGSATLDAAAPRIAAPEVWQALSGVAAASWRPAREPGAVVLTAAIPLRDHADVRGALVFEQVDRALPLLANRAVIELSAATLVALVVAALLLSVVGVSLSLRIGRLRDAADRAARRSGRLDGPLPLADAPDELGDLARSFGKLLSEIAANTDYLSTLASKLSHELNTPLAVVKSSLENLEAGTSDAATRAYLARARDGADRLGAIVRSMSEANRIERAIASAEAEDFDLRALVAGCAESYRALIGDGELRVALPQDAIALHGAPDLIAQALDKLFDNARSFTPAHGWISIALDAPAAAAPARIRVANSGPLLPAMAPERLFDSLVSLRTRRSGAKSHLGLGLYVVRLVAIAHRGHVSARNLADSSGVEFTLEVNHISRQPIAGGVRAASGAEDGGRS